MSDLESLRRVLADRNLVMLLGAGVSTDPPACLPDWLRLRDLTISAIADQHAELSLFARMLGEFPMISIPDRRGLAPEMVASMINANCSGYFESFRALEEGTPNYNHRLIATVAAQGLIRYLVTTNFDTFLEAALEESGVPYVVYRDEEEFRGFRGCEDAHVHVLKLHGSIDLPESITATVEQEARGLSAAKVSALDQLLDGRWLGVWGYSGADLKIDVDYLRLLLNQGSCCGFFWSLFQSHQHIEQPNSFVLDIAEAYGARGSIAGGLFPSALEHVLPPGQRPACPAIDARQSEVHRQRKTEQLERRLADWAHTQVSPFLACIILGDLLRYAGYSAEATQCYREGGTLADLASDRAAFTYATAMQADLATETGAFDMATSLWHRVEQVAAEEIGDADMLVQALSGRLRLASRRGDLVQAERLSAMIRSMYTAGQERPPLPTFMLSSLALLKRNQGDYDESFALWAEAAKRHRISGDRLSLATALQGMAASHLKFGEFEKARAALREAKESNSAISNRDGMVQVLLQLAQLQMATHEHVNASASLDEAEELARTIENESLALSVQDTRLLWHAMQSGRERDSATVALAEATVAGWRRLGETRRLGITLSYLANLLQKAGDTVRAHEARVEALQVLLRAEDRLNAGHIAEIIALEEDGNDTQALGFFQLAITNLRLAGQHDLAADLIVKMRPVIARLEGNAPWTLESVVATMADLDVDQHHALITDLGCDVGPASLADCMREIAASSGEAFAVQRLNVAVKVQAGKDQQEGRDWSAWSLAGLRLSHLVRDDYSAGLYLNDLGLAAKGKGDLPLAISRYTGAGEIARNLGDLLEENVRMCNLAIVLAMADRLEEATAAALRAGQAALSIVRTERLRSLMNAAMLLEEFRQWNEALPCFTEAVREASGTLDEKTLARAYQGRGKALRELGALDESATAREAAARVYSALGERLSEGYMLFLAGNTLIGLPERSEHARALLNSSLEVATTEHDEDLAVKATAALTRIAEIHQAD